ncbi:MAG: type II toxin-antitoxin system RelE/ParE family toxin [Clostridia bacterium]|nr:type II toxin-antitoxin system RelE/ParE family toxin [Clostridia bacterium]MCI9275601.1 type II toxin-antitoxin system RelE/ParE family toxin [Clostridia bacterium]
MYTVELYKDKHGKSEVHEYIQKLNKNNSKENRQRSKKISAYIDLLAESGLTLKEPYIKKIAKEIWELRPLRDRILFASYYNSKFVLLSIFTKKTQKTPKLEIEKAKRLLEDYKKRSVDK